VNLNIKVSKILYEWILLLNPFGFCETYYWARGSEAQRAEAAARHQGKSTSKGKKFGPPIPGVYRNFLSIPGVYRIFFGFSHIPGFNLIFVSSIPGLI